MCVAQMHIYNIYFDDTLLCAAARDARYTIFIGVSDVNENAHIAYAAASVISGSFVQKWDAHTRQYKIEWMENVNALHHYAKQCKYA